MSLTGIIIAVIALGLIVSAVLLLKQSAKKFDLTEEQLKKIEARNALLEKEEKKAD
ncbi:DUF2897 family protein [Colwellia sp. UCD-KL20]|uniref:DUF2897 family protein n=1 Tax=Colwellia sp. UCD-KL20 TaxID=1917165 RepID=UPI0009FB5D40|nr:DUF2897 family protein [Colwellia sp. UCD-KL20]